MRRSGRKSAMQRWQSSSFTRLYSRLRGTPSSFTRPRSRETSWLPRKPEPPVTTTRLSAQKSGLDVGELILHVQQVGSLDQLVDARFHVDLGLEPPALHLGVRHLVVAL